MVQPKQDSKIIDISETLLAILTQSCIKVARSSVAIFKVTKPGIQADKKTKKHKKEFSRVL